MPLSMRYIRLLSAVLLVALLPLMAAASPLPDRVAIMAFHQVGTGDDTDLGRTVAEMLLSEAFNARAFDVVDRHHLQELISERHMGENSQEMGGNAAQQIADMAGADGLLTGVVACMGGDVRIDARLIDVKSGQVLATANDFARRNLRDIAAASARIMNTLLGASQTGEDSSTPPSQEKDKDPTAPGRLYVHTTPQDARIRVMTVRPKYHPGMELHPGRHVIEVSHTGYGLRKETVHIAPGRETHVDVSLVKKGEEQPGREGFAFAMFARKDASSPPRSVHQGDVLHSGEHYKITFEPHRDGYVYILQVDAAGQVFQLFPMQRYGDMTLDNVNPVRQGASYTLPAPDKAFYLDQTRGKETIYCFIAPERQTHFEALYAELTQARAAGDSQQAASLQQELLELIAERPLAQSRDFAQSVQTPWSETGEIVAGMGQWLQELEGERVHVLEFMHE